MIKISSAQQMKNTEGNAARGSTSKQTFYAEIMTYCRRET